MIKRALISVSDKTGVVELGKRLSKAGVEIISTGGTAQALSAAGVPVTGISDVTGFPEILDGRVKTLHPKVHGGLLARRDSPEHMKALASLGIDTIDVVVVNLYPFRKTVSKPGVSLEEAIENIDIGGPSMIRSAAKNHQDVVVLVNPARYDEVLNYIEAGQPVPAEMRFNLAVEAFEHTGAYDALISSYFGKMTHDHAEFPDDLVLRLEKAQTLRYGENPHQKAALYIEPFFHGPAVTTSEKLHGKELSYNNIMDADAALSLVLEFEEPCAVAVKHANPCGVAVGKDIVQAYNLAFEADPVSIFGGIVALNRPVTLAVAQAMQKLFFEILIAPAFDADALEMLEKKKDLRILKYPDVKPEPSLDMRRVFGGMLVQERDTILPEAEPWQVVTDAAPTDAQMKDLRFAWKVVKYVKSNAIVLVKNGQTVGIGPGQPNRIDSARLAIGRAGEKARDSVMASDAYMPFPDVAEAARDAGVAAIVQPGGSIRDDATLKVAVASGIPLVFTGTRHFRH